MRSTIDVLAQELRFGLMTAEVGHFNDKNFQRVASVINLVSIALQGKEVDRSVEVAIDGAIRTMNEIDERITRLGSHSLNEFQIAAISAGIQKIEETLPKLSINELREAKIILDICNARQIQNTNKTVQAM